MIAPPPLTVVFRVEILFKSEFINVTLVPNPATPSNQPVTVNLVETFSSSKLST